MSSIRSSLSSQVRPQHAPHARLRHQPASLDHHFGLSSSDSDTDHETTNSCASVSKIRSYQPRRRRQRLHRNNRGHYEVNPVVSDLSSIPLQHFALPREPSTTSTSSSSTSSPSEASFDLVTDLIEHSQSSEVRDLGPNRAVLRLALPPKGKQDTDEDHSEQPIQPPVNCHRLTLPRNSSAFWDLITDVAKDLELSLHDLLPDVSILGLDLSGGVNDLICARDNVANSVPSGEPVHGASAPSPAAPSPTPSPLTQQQLKPTLKPSPSGAPTTQAESYSYECFLSSSNCPTTSNLHAQPSSPTSDHHHYHHEHTHSHHCPCRGRVQANAQSQSKKASNLIKSNQVQSRNRARRGSQQQQPRPPRLSHQSSLDFYVPSRVKHHFGPNKSKQSDFGLFTNTFQSNANSLPTPLLSPHSSTSSSPALTSPLLNSSQLRSSNPDDVMLVSRDDSQSSLDLIPSSNSLFERHLISQIRSSVSKVNNQHKLKQSSSPSRIPVRVYNSSLNLSRAANSRFERSQLMQSKPMVQLRSKVYPSLSPTSQSLSKSPNSKTLDQPNELSHQSSIPRLNSVGNSSNSNSPARSASSAANSNSSNSSKTKLKSISNSSAFIPSSTFFSTNNKNNVSTNSTPKVLRPAPPPPNSSPPTQTRTTSRDIPNSTSEILVKKITSSVNGSAAAVLNSRIPESKLEKLTELENEIDKSEVTHHLFLQEDAVDDDEEVQGRENGENVQRSSTEEVRLKIAIISNEKHIILNESDDSSPEDLFESQDDEHVEEEECDEEVVEDSSAVNTLDFPHAHKKSAPPIPADKGPDLEERLRLSQPIWYLPHINRATVVHYLQGKNVGVFIIRQSSKPQTLAISVRLPHGRGPHVEHYLIEKRNTSKCNCLYRLEGSEHYFTTILNLVVHYSNCCDELPVRLALPPVLRTSTSGRNQLTSLALLGQEFWQSKFVQLKQLPRNSLNTETLALVSSDKDVEPKVFDEPKPLLPPRRRNSNSSSNTSLSSSSAQSHSTASPVLIPRKKLGIEQQPEVITRNRSPITKSSPPPPLPPKSPDSVSLSSELSRIVESPEKNLGQSAVTESTPKLPPRRIELPPPIPPRSKDNCFKDNKTSPPPRPTANKRSSPSSQVVQLNDLLSPMFMTESEIDEILSKQSVPEHPRLPSPSGLAAAKANYYNHIASSNSGKLSPPQTQLAQQSTSILSTSQTKNLPDLITSPSTEQNLKVGCNVYTQTEVPKHPPPPKPKETPPARPNSNLSDSSYYMDPIDALVVINGMRNSLALEFNALEQAHPQKRNYSDPELASQKEPRDTNTGFAGSNHNSIHGHSLESLLEIFKNRYPTASTIRDQKREFFQNVSTQHEKIDRIEEALEDDGGGRVRLSIKPDAGFSTVDSMWQWHDCAQKSSDKVCEVRCRPQQQQPEVPSHNNKRSSISVSIQSDVTTVEDILSSLSPEFVVSKMTLVSECDSAHHNTNGNGTGMYDNLSKEELANMKKLNGGSFRSTKTDGTDFSEPWNMDMVESRILSEFGSAAASGSSLDEYEFKSLDSVSLDATAQLLNNDLIHFNSYLLDKESDKPSHYSLDQDYDNVAEDEDYDEYHPMNGTGQHNYPMKRDDSEVTLTNVDVNGNNSTDDANSPQNIMLDIVNNISLYVFELAERKDNTFAKSIHNFIECTKEGTETSPTVILGYIRQFMNGMKNYLIKHGEGEFLCIVKRERSRLKPHQFLNIDSILECALQKLIIAPLKNYIYEICIRAYNSSGALKILSHNIKLAQKASPVELGIKAEMLPIEATVMAEIQHNLRRLQQSYSPIKKLEHLLRVFGLIRQHLSQKSKQNGGRSTKPVYSRSLSGEDMVAMLLYTIVQCGLVSVQIEMEYMLGLLHSSILNTGDATYYLNVASSAIQQLLTNMYDGGSTVLEHVHSTSTASVNGCVMSASLVLSILIPNELTSSIGCKQVPVRPNMSAKEVCRMIAHTHRITNPEHYALYRIKDLQDHALADADLPQMIKHQMMQRGEPMPIFAYKRCDANFIWPDQLPGTEIHDRQI